VLFGLTTSLAVCGPTHRPSLLRIISSRAVRACPPQADNKRLGYWSAGKGEVELPPETTAGLCWIGGRGKLLCSHHGPTWNSEALRLITTLFLSSACAFHSSHAPSDTNASTTIIDPQTQQTKWESATPRPRRCAPWGPRSSKTSMNNSEAPLATMWASVKWAHC